MIGIVAGAPNDTNAEIATARRGLPESLRTALNGTTTSTGVVPGT